MRSELRAKRRLNNRVRRDKLSDFSIHGRRSSSWPYRLRSLAHLRNRVEPAIGQAELSAAHMMLRSVFTIGRATSSRRTNTRAILRSGEIPLEKVASHTKTSTSFDRAAGHAPCKTHRPAAAFHRKRSSAEEMALSFTTAVELDLPLNDYAARRN